MRESVVFVVLRFVCVCVLAAYSANAFAAGGTLRVALASFEEDNFDPKFSGGTTQMRLGIPIYDYLTLLNAKAEVVPGLATSWDLTPDGRVYTFYLRPGVKFQNGDPLTSADVKFSIVRQMEKDSKNTIAGALRGMIAAIETPSPATVVIRLNEADPDLLLNLSPYLGGAPVVPASYMNRVGVDAFARAPIGSGPWKVVSHEPGSTIEYEAVPGHWRSQPQFSKLVLLAVPEESGRIAMLERGEADVAEISVGRASELKAKNLRVTTIPRVMQLGVLYYSSWVDPKSPMADIRVRRALAHAVDSDAIIKGVLLGQGERSLPWGIFPGAAFADASRPSQKPVSYDPALARKLLREAGYERGFDLNFYSVTLSGASFLTRVADVVANNWKQVGVNVRMVPIEFGAFRSMYRGRDPKLNGTATVFRYPSVFDAAFNCQDRGVIRTNGSQPINSDKRVDELCEAAIKEPNPQTRVEKMKRVFDYIDDQVFFGFTIAYGHALYASSPKTIADWTPIQSYLDLGPIYERMLPAQAAPAGK